MYDRQEIAFLDERLASHRASAFCQLRWGPMATRRPNFGVVRFEPRGGEAPSLYVTTAVSRGRRRRSFVALVEPGGRRPLRFLTALAWWHSGVAMATPIPGAVMPLCEPWSNGRDETHVVLSRPRLFGEGWRTLVLPELRWDMVWAQAVDAQGAWIARQLGPNALDSRIEHSGLRLRQTKEIPTRGA